jgi:hypothetical protein
MRSPWPYDFPQPENPREEMLSALITCWIEISCCKGMLRYPVKLMLMRHTDMRLGDAVDRLRCKKCRGKPHEVWLNQVQNREPGMGSPPGWSVRLL